MFNLPGVLVAFCFILPSVLAKQGPLYNCSDAENPSIDCSQLTPQQCNDPSLRNVIIDNCPDTCGLCFNIKKEECVDKLRGCELLGTICTRPEWDNFARKNCALSCKKCGNEVVDSTAYDAVCRDRSKEVCLMWKRDGFCENNRYPLEVLKIYCARTCKLC